MSGGGTALFALVATIVLAAIGCRSVIGVEDLELAATDGGVDAKVGDTSAPMDALPPPDGPTSPCKGNTNCRMCCRTMIPMTGTDRLEIIAADNNCICACQECINNACATPRTKDMMCGKCVDDIFTGTAPLSPACMTTQTLCNQEQGCKEALDCLISCRPP